MKKQTRPRKLKPTVQRLIYERALSQRSIPREFLANQLIREIEEIGDVAPTLETAKRYISKARNSDSPLDKPWTLGACHEYPVHFPPGSETILMRYNYLHKWTNIGTNEKSWNQFSIRKAMWMVRLQPTIIERFKPSDFESESDIVFNISGAYSFAEYTSELMGEKSFNSSDLDEALYFQKLDNIFMFGFSGVRKTKSFCKGDCNSCKYVPLVKGELCYIKRKGAHNERDDNQEE